MTHLARLLLIFGALALCAAEPKWEFFHGPNRDNVCLETGLLKVWPASGPELIWQFKECGTGYAMVAFAEGRIFTSGDFGDDEMVLALDMQGKLLWKTKNGQSWKGSYPGARTTPAYDNGAVYHMGPKGMIAALKSDTGETLWSVDLQERFGVRYGIWGLSENVVVAGDKVLCMPGGEKGLVVALDKKSGATVWANTELDLPAAYCSPILVTYQGVTQYITLTGESVIGIDAATGKRLWQHPHPSRYNQAINTPIFHEGYIFVASGHSAGGRMFKVNPDNRTTHEIWYRKDLDNCHGTVILRDGWLYGCSCRLGGKSFFCADFMTGEIKYQELNTTKRLGKMSITWADGRFYGIGDEGNLLLIEPGEDKFNIVSRHQVPREGEGKYLSHPVIFQKRLYIRHWNNLFVYDIADK